MHGLRRSSPGHSPAGASIFSVSGLWLVDAGSPSLDAAEHFDTLAQLAAAVAREHD
ncbi:hypothetical protein ACSMEV_12810 [Pseudomonas sp. MLB6B]